jgi:hypothetical protein
MHQQCMLAWTSEHIISRSAWYDVKITNKDKRIAESKKCRPDDRHYPVRSRLSTPSVPKESDWDANTANNRDRQSILRFHLASRSGSLLCLALEHPVAREREDKRSKEVA